MLHCFWRSIFVYAIPFQMFSNIHAVAFVCSSILQEMNTFLLKKTPLSFPSTIVAAILSSTDNALALTSAIPLVSPNGTQSPIVRSPVIDTRSRGPLRRDSKHLIIPFMKGRGPRVPLVPEARGFEIAFVNHRARLRGARFSICLGPNSSSPFARRSRD